MLGRGWFITGTDTNIGKTATVLALLRGYAEREFAVVGVKPLASGGGGDLMQMRRFSRSPLANSPECGRYQWEKPIAPHLAANESGALIDFLQIGSDVQWLRSSHDYVLVEGAGGVRVPLGKQGDMRDLIKILGLPVIIVVGMRLGCINHAVLTEESLLAANIPILGWIANELDPTMLYLEQNRQTLVKTLRSSYLGNIPFISNSDGVPSSDTLHWEQLK